MTVFIETQRLFLKVPTQADFDNWCKAYAEMDNEPISTQLIKTRLLQQMSDYSKHGFCMCSVYIKQTNEFIGRAGLFHSCVDGANLDVEIGYGLLKSFWGVGYASELACALIKWGLSHLAITRIIALTDETNLPSRHILEKAGMHYIGKMHVENKDFLFYEILKPKIR